MDSTRGNKSVTEIPYVEVPINTSRCAINYTNSMLVSACDILPLFSPPDGECVVVGPGCNKTTCQVPSLDATIEVILYNCLQSLNIGFVVTDRQTNKILWSKKITETSIFNDTRRNNSQVSFTVVEHPSELSVGLRVS